MSKISDERTKLTANWLNAIAAGSIVTGAVAPMVAVFFGIPGPAQASAVLIGVSMAIWLFAGVTLHLAARVILRNLGP